MAGAATGATLGALLFVSVDDCRVRLGDNSHELALAAGQSEKSLQTDPAPD
jgi:hypothetical protein